MASCIEDNESGGQMSRKKKRQRFRNNINKLNFFNKQSHIVKRATKKTLKRLNWNVVKMNKELNRGFEVCRVDKKGVGNNNGVADVHERKLQSTNKKRILCDRKKVVSSDSVIVCDSDMDTDSDPDVIEIHDSMSESMDEKSAEKMEDDDVIILDDTKNEEDKTPCKRIRFEGKGSENKDKSNTKSTPNSIVIIVANTPSKPQNTSETEVIDIEDSIVEEPTDTTPKNVTNPTKHMENLRSNSQVGNSQTVAPNFIPLTTTPTKSIRNLNRTINKSPRNNYKPSGSVQSIKITVCGSGRSFENVNPHKPTATVTSSDNGTHNLFPSAVAESSTSSSSSSSSQMTTSLLPISTGGSAFGGNLYNAGHSKNEGLRDIVIDGSNVAMGHSLGKYFSVKGLKICIDYFIQRGHKVKAFVPHFRIKHGQSSEPALLRQLHDQGLVVLTPSRIISGKKITCYDDRLLVQCAAELGAVVVSGDNYRDLLRENPSLRETIEKRLLIPTWVDDIIMFPSDPLGRFGPSLDQFLRFP